MTRPPPYVGVSGITTPEQARAILDMWPASAPPQSLMLGVLTSAKVLAGGERNPRSPAPESFASIFQADPRVLNLVHYFTKDTAELGEQMLHAVAPGNIHCEGIQINVPWPPPDQLDHFRRWGDWDRVVLQIGPKILGPRPIDGIGIAQRIDREYQGLITDVLLDASGGNGKPIDVIVAEKMVELVREWCGEDIGVGIAGGLCADALPSVAALVVEHGLSIDAEGKLRDEGDELDLDKVRVYLNSAAAMWGWA